MNLIFWINGSSATIPFSTLIALLALWFGVSVPLTFIGAYFGFKKRVIVKILLGLHEYLTVSWYDVNKQSYYSL